jgi:hypothetical protein
MPDRTHGMHGQSENAFRGGEDQYNPRKTNEYSFVDLNVINRKLLYIHNKLYIPCRN